MSAPVVRAIVNPRAGRGRAEQLWAPFAASLREIGADVSTGLTQYRGHAIELAGEAASAGAACVVAVGGDGTVSEVANGVLTASEDSGYTPSVGIVSCGTGKDFVRTVSIPQTPAAFAEAVADDATISLDAARITCTGEGGEDLIRWCINVADFGLGADVVEQVERFSRRLGSRFAYFVGVLSYLFSLNPHEISWSIDGSSPSRGRFITIVTANGRYFGSGMHVAPGAAPDDGLLDFVMIGDAGRLEALGLLARIYGGKLGTHPRVQTLRGSRIRAEAGTRVPIEADGEVIGTLPATIEIVPNALRFLGGATARGAGKEA